MAEHASDHVRGEMDIQMHQAAYAGFTAMAKWGSLAVAALVLMLTIWFCTDAGFLPALISALVVAVGGIVLLREKPQQAGAH